MRATNPRTILAITIALAVLSYAAYTFLSIPRAVSLPNPPSRFAVNGRTFGITYIAADQNSRATGLMNKKVTNSTTMLFVFPSPGEYSFWMSGVNTTLDIIWLNVSADVGRVVYMVRNVPGCSSPVSCPVYQPYSTANWVLEVKGGFAEAHGVEVGTTVTFS